MPQEAGGERVHGGTGLGARSAFGRFAAAAAGGGAAFAFAFVAATGFAAFLFAGGAGDVSIWKWREESGEVSRYRFERL